MRFQNFFKSLTSTPTRRRPIRPRPLASRLCLETLEDRCLLSFGLPVNYGVGLAPGAAAADFNGDGRLDLAAANSGNNTVSVLLGNGDGTFQAARTYAAPNPQSVLAADLNGDGKTDLVTLGPSVLLGNGDGTFQPPHGVGLGMGAAPPPGYSQVDGRVTSVAVGDLNADGKLDLVANGWTLYSMLIGYDPDSGYPIYQYYSNTYLSVVLGNGDGTFGPGTTYNAPNFYGDPNFLSLWDFNGDGRPDVVANDGWVMLGNGDGTLQNA